MAYGLGFIGFGWMAYYHYSHILPQVGGIKPVAVYDTDEERVKFGEKLGLAPYCDLAGFLKDDRIDVVLVATPNDSHKDLTIAALQSGKHVICEKPMAMSCLEGAEMIGAAKKYGRVFSVHQNRRWDKDFRIVKKTIDDEVIGIPYYIETRVQGSNGIPGDWRRQRKSGGGMLFDWGVHSIDQLLSLVNSPVMEVYTQLLRVNYKEVDDNVKVNLKFKNGVCALAEVDTNCFLPLPRWHVSGEKGTLKINDFRCEGSIVIGTVNEVDWSLQSVSTAAGPTRTMRPRPNDTVQELPLPEVNTEWSEYYKNFIAVLEGKQELKVKPEECLRVMKVLEAAFRSSEEGVCVKGEI